MNIIRCGGDNIETYIAECKNCKCVFEFEKHEAEEEVKSVREISSLFQEGLVFLKIRCPQCNMLVWHR